MKKWFYTKGEEFLKHSVNKTFEEVLWMTEDEFRAWWKELRQVIVKFWDEQGQPPRVGYSEEEIIDQFRDMEQFFTQIKGNKQADKFICKDEITGDTCVIRNNSVVGNAVNQWFPTMMKTKITYGDSTADARSIYDHFADTSDKMFEKVIKYARRHFKRDSFYHYSAPVRAHDPKRDSENTHFLKENLFLVQSGVQWIKEFERTKRRKDGYDYWLEPKEEESEYSGYNDALRDVTWLRLTKADVVELGSLIPEKCKTNIDSKKGDTYNIRLFKYGQKLFPVGLKAFRVSYCQYAVNFPPLTAKFLYETYLKKLGKKAGDRSIIYDPSSGWGGRLLGAMSVNRRVYGNVHYVGTDPNTDHNTDNGRTKYHEFADFYNNNLVKQIFATKPNTYHIFQHGSEEISNDVEFQKYKGQVDIVFTSPPYFAKEVYSADANQSCNKFGQYKEWRDGFLKPTLKTATEWLREGGYLLWNIADAKFGKDMLPLEDDSKKFIEEFGLVYETTWKMALAQMPGGNRVDDGKPTAKNFVQVDSLWLKYEPVFVFRKI